MDRIQVEAFAKVNLSIDLLGILPNGYHQVEMVMQQIGLHDDVQMQWTPGGEGLRIRLTTSREDLPADRRNLAWRAAEAMQAHFPHDGELTIHIVKRIPVAAGMAGGSSNGAAVLHGINQLWDLKLDVAQLNKIGAELGSDIPFCIMGQAAAAESLRQSFATDPLACHCALATGTGTDLAPLPGLKAYLALSKPPIPVSTRDVYEGMDKLDILTRPDNQALIRGLEEQNLDLIYGNMVNVLELYTLMVYSDVVYTKDKMQSLSPSGPVLMSGSGPTVFAVCASKEEADALRDAMKKINEESYSTSTTY